jgi:hypothetical protein
VTDNSGKFFKVKMGDPRLESGEVWTACKGKVWMHNADGLNKRVFPADTQAFEEAGWILGQKRKLGYKRGPNKVKGGGV